MEKENGKWASNMPILSYFPSWWPDPVLDTYTGTDA